MKSLCVFCGASAGTRPAYADAARRLGTLLAERNITLVFGGSARGLMTVLADAVLAAGGAAIGVIPRALVDREIAHPGLTELHVVGSMHERKQKMADLSDGFVALPGGFGTLDETRGGAHMEATRPARQAVRPARRRRLSSRRCSASSITRSTRDSSSPNNAACSSPMTIPPG